MGETKLRVRLLKYTPEPEKIVAVASRLCYSSDAIESIQSKMEQVDTAPFIKKLFRIGHLSPFEHVSFTFGIEGVSRSLLAQITRHRIASFSVKSQRYVSEMGSETFEYVIPQRIKEMGSEFEKEFKKQMHKIQDWYNYWCSALGEDALEDARFVLPNAAETKIIITMNARELFHFFNLRCCNRAQWEIRNLAWEMLKHVKNVAPNVFVDAGPRCIVGSCSEGEMACKKALEVKEKYKKLGSDMEV